MQRTDPTLATPPILWWFLQPEDKFWVAQNKMWKDSKRAWIGIAAVYATVLWKWGFKKFGRYLTFFIKPLFLESVATNFTSNHGFLLASPS